MKVQRIIEIDIPDMGFRIEQARRRDPRLIEKIAKECGMTRANWYKIEQGKNKTLTEETLRKIEKVLGVDFGIKF